MAAPQAPRSLHARRLPLLPEQALLPVLRHSDPQPHLTLAGPGLGCQGIGRRTLTPVDPEVPRAAVLDLRPCGQGPGPGPQPVRPHRAAQGHRSQDPHPDPRRVRTSPRRTPPAASADGRDADRGRTPLGRARRPQTPPHRLPPPHPHRRGDHRRALQEGLPHRTALPRQALPQGQRTPHHRRPPGLARPDRRPHRHPPHRSRRPALPHQGRHPHLPQHLPHPHLATRRQSLRHRASTSASTTSATPTPPGCWPAAPTSSPSWTAWATPRSKPPRNTSTPSPTPTNATSTPSRACKVEA